MSDEHLRLLQRKWQESADQAACEAFLRESIRCGTAKGLPIEAWVGCVDKSIRPEVITVPKQGDRMVLVRSPLVREFAFFVWAQRGSSTMWSIRFRTTVGNSRDFHLICACCPVECYGIDGTDEPTERGFNKKKRLRKELRDRLAAICREKQIHTVFMRKVAEWPRFGRIEGLRMVEGDNYYPFMKEKYTADHIQHALSFIANPELR